MVQPLLLVYISPSIQEQIKSILIIIDFIIDNIVGRTNRMNIVLFFNHTGIGQVQTKKSNKKKVKTHRIVTLLFLFVSGPRLALARLLSGKQAVCCLSVAV